MPSAPEKDALPLRAPRADIHRRTASDHGLSERPVLFTIPYITESLIIDVTHCMAGQLIKAAWHHIAVNSHDGRGPHP